MHKECNFQVSLCDINIDQFVVSKSVTLSIVINLDNFYTPDRKFNNL